MQSDCNSIRQPFVMSVIFFQNIHCLSNVFTCNFTAASEVISCRNCVPLPGIPHHFNSPKKSRICMIREEFFCYKMVKGTMEI